MTVIVFWPVSLRKLIFISGAAASVPPSTTTARITVRPECLSVQFRIGRYPRCSGVGGASGCSGSMTSPSAFFSSLPGLRNQYASTGTIVSDTRSEATIAIVTVIANGRNSSPTMSPTKTIGRNTATVVIVDAVIAAATSRTARRIASPLSAPPT